MGLRFESPFINMSIQPEDFIKIALDVKRYLSEPLEHAYDEINYAAPNHHDSPVGRLGDVLLHMYHYPDFENAKEKWEERKSRINWDNILFSMWTNDKEIIQKADKIKEKKIVFTELKIEKDYIVCLDSPKYSFGTLSDTQSNAVAHRMNGCATGRIKRYDIFDLLLNGVVKKNVRIKENENFIDGMGNL